ncbi:hypothetical protein LPJ56_007219, partial [Coemansia sp. RSA 2599]
ATAAARPAQRPAHQRRRLCAGCDVQPRVCRGHIDHSRCFGKHGLRRQNAGNWRHSRMHSQDGRCAAGSRENPVPDSQRKVCQIHRHPFWPFQSWRGHLQRIRDPRPVPGSLDAACPDISLCLHQVHDLRAAQKGAWKTNRRPARPKLSRRGSVRCRQRRSQLSTRHDPRPYGVHHAHKRRPGRTRARRGKADLQRARVSLWPAQLLPRLPS